MPRKPFEIFVEPKVLTWARETIGLYPENVSEKLGESPDFIDKLETSKEKPTLKILERLANIYKRPLATFLLSTPPKELPLPKDFRYMPRKKEMPLSPKTRLSIRSCFRMQSLAVGLLKELGREISPKIKKFNTHEDPEVVAEEIRNELGISISEQKSWQNKYQAFQEWREAIERRGIFVFQMSMPLKEIRGFSLIEAELPVIVVNSQDFIAARIFSLFHELSHFLIDKSGICNMRTPIAMLFEKENIESFCNHFAGSLLIPKATLLNHELACSICPSDNNDKIVKKLANEFKVSQEVVLRRMAILGMINIDVYKKKREEWEEIEWKPKGGGPTDPIEKCIREKGKPLITLTLEAYEAGKITYKDAADYLSVRIKYLSEIEHQIR